MDGEAVALTPAVPIPRTIIANPSPTTLAIWEWLKAGRDVTNTIKHPQKFKLQSSLSNDSGWPLKVACGLTSSLNRAFYDALAIFLR
jgi:hypothetical protein